jgi:DNA-binding transcriptional LysR family regulator
VKDVQLVFREYTADALLAALRVNTIELGVLHGHITDPLLSGVVVDREKCVLAIPARHKLAQGRRSIALTDLENETLLVPPKTSFHGLYEEISDACVRAGVSPRMSSLAPGAHALIGLVEAEVGVAIVPSSITLARKGVVYRKLIGEPIAVERRLYWQKHDHSSVVQKFVKLVTSWTAK